MEDVVPDSPKLIVEVPRLIIFDFGTYASWALAPEAHSVHLLQLPPWGWGRQLRYGRTLGVGNAYHDCFLAFYLRQLQARDSGSGDA